MGMFSHPKQNKASSFPWIWISTCKEKKIIKKWKCEISVGVNLMFKRHETESLGLALIEMRVKIMNNKMITNKNGNHLIIILIFVYYIYCSLFI